MMSSTLKFRRSLRTFLTVAGLAAVIGGASVAPALADDWHRDRDARHWQQERREHARQAHEWRERHYRPAPSYYPGYYYYPPPPPVVYAPPPSLRLVFPFNFH